MTSAANTPEIARLDPNAKADDQIPAVEGDSPSPQPSADAPPPAPAPEGKEDQDAGPKMLPDRRAEIAARFAQHRDDDGTEGEGEEEEADEPPPPEEPAPEIKEPPAAEKPETFKIKVRGNEYTVNRAQLLQLAEVDEDEAKDYSPVSLVRLAQKQAAATEYLNEVRELNKGARTAAKRPAATPAATEADDDDGDLDAAPTPSDPYEEAAEKTQFGDTKEAAAALRKAVQSELNMAAQAKQSEKIGQDIDDAAAAFSEKNEDLMGDEVIGNLVYTQTLHELRDDLVKIGVPQDRIDLVRDVPTAVQAHKEARLRKMDVRSPAQILEAAGEKVRTRLNIHKPSSPNPAPAQSPVSDRGALKRSLPTQPVRASVTQETLATPTPQPRSSIVENMRRARGQPV